MSACSGIASSSSPEAAAFGLALSLLVAGSVVMVCLPTGRSGTAWPGTLGMIVYIGGSGQLADSFAVRFPDIAARCVFTHQIHAIWLPARRTHRI